MAEIVDPPLSAFVQTQNDALQVYSDAGISRWTTTYKGPYDKLNTIYTELPSLVQAGTTPDDFDALVRTTGIAVDRKLAYPEDIYDAKSVKHEWTLSNIRLSEVNGEQATLVAEFSPDGDIWIDPKSELSAADTADWSVSWEAYSVSPYAFCAQDEHQDKLSYEADAANDQKSNRQHIKLCYAQTNSTDSQAQTFGAYTIDAYSTSVKLNKHEKEILKKVCQDKSALYHYPVVSLRETWSSLSSMSDGPSGENIGEKIDHIVDTLPGDSTGGSCPYSFQQNWEWVMTDDTVSYSTTKIKSKKTYNATRSRSWRGSLSADVNFYGNENEGDIAGRWKVGEM